MTIKELIEKLQQYPPTAEVKLQSPWGHLVSVTGLLSNAKGAFAKADTVILIWRKA